MVARARLQRIGANIRRHRHAAQLSQEELAARARITQTYLSQIERGERSFSVLVLLDLARALHVEPQDLLTRRD